MISQRGLPPAALKVLALGTGALGAWAQFLALSTHQRVTPEFLPGLGLSILVYKVDGETHCVGTCFSLWKVLGWGAVGP